MNTLLSQRAGGVIFAALMPHAPILIPAIGGDKLKPVSASVSAMQLVAARLCGSRPESVVLISPHSPRRAGSFGIWSEPSLKGDFGRFGAPQIALQFSNDLALVAELKLQAQASGLSTWDIDSLPLDHGALVPLWYLAQAGWNGPIAVLSLNYSTFVSLQEFGVILNTAAVDLGRCVAVIASGDISHRPTRGALSVYEPQAADFDSQFINCLKKGAYRDLLKIHPDLGEIAAEDTLSSTIVALTAANWSATGHAILSYPGRFGVGYAVAILFESEIWAHRHPVKSQEGARAQRLQM